MKVADIMSSQVATCRPEDSLSRAAQVMWDGDCGAVVVVDPSRRPVGIVTDRDACMAAWSQDRAPAQITVGAVMASEVVTCTLGQSAQVVHETLRVHQLHRLPVVDTGGVLVGVVSLSDLVQRGGSEQGAAAAVLETVAAVTRPREPVTTVSASAQASPPAPAPQRQQRVAEPVAIIPAVAPAPAAPAKAPSAAPNEPVAAAPEPEREDPRPRVGRKLTRNIPAKKASANRKKKKK